MLVIPLVSLSVGISGEPQLIPPGKFVELPDDEATQLIERGFAKLGTQGEKKNNNTSLLDAVIDAISELPSDSFGKDGKPHVKALENILGQSITATLRDSAWEAYQKLTADED